MHYYCLRIIQLRRPDPLCIVISAISAKGLMRFMTVEGKVDATVFVRFLERLIDNQSRPIFLIVDGHPIHKSKKVKEFVGSTKGRLCLFFLPPYAPDLNPDELVWNHVKNHKVGRMALDGRNHLRSKVIGALRSLQRLPDKIRGFFQKPSVVYAAI